MFDYISDRFTSIFDKLRYGGKLTEENIREGLREVRRALLEADVHVEVVRSFLDTVTAKAVGEAETDIPFAKHGPTVILMAGLQGSGKTTSCAKLAKLLDGTGKRCLLVAADLQRPAAIEQLRVLGGQINVP